MISDIIWYIGLFVVLTYVINICRWIKQIFCQRDYSGWALITAGSDGIGKGFAVSLAKKKVNLVLISKTY